MKEQVESLGAKFIDVPYETAEEKEAAEGVGGYARPMPRAGSSARRSRSPSAWRLADIVITTALIPGRAAPVLVTEDMVQAMKPGSVIVDLAAAPGRQLPAHRARQDGGQARRHARRRDQPGRRSSRPMPSALYARNVLDFLKLVLPKDGAFTVPMDDDIVAACLMTQGGEVRRK